jgi:REP element-mobilizing transposase RayT
VTARGNERRDIAADDEDRRFFLDLFGYAANRFQWIVYQYVLMTNHYHFVLELADRTLSQGMQWLNSRYVQLFNRRHKRSGHLFQGRFDSRLVEKETYLLEVIRYNALNPVRARIVELPENYEWSGHRAIAGLAPAPSWLAVDRTLSCFAPDLTIARTFYKRFVDEGIGLERSPWKDVVGQIYLGTEAWLDRVRSEVESRPRPDEHAAAQREPISCSVNDIITAVASTLSVTENDIRYGRGGDARMLVAWLASRRFRFNLRSIAAALRVNSTARISAMAKSCENRFRSDTAWSATMERCLSILRVV